MRVESNPDAHAKQPNRLNFGRSDFSRAQQILDNAQAGKGPEHVGRVAGVREWQFYQQRGGQRTEAIGDIAEAAVFSILNHKESPLSSLKNMQASVELASREDDILKGFDGVLKVSSGGHELVRIYYDATTNPTAVARKMEEAVFYPKNPAHTKLVLGFDIGAPDSPWPTIKEGRFPAPFFRLLLKEIELQLRAHESYAKKIGDIKRVERCRKELLLVQYLTQSTPPAIPANLLKDRVFLAIEEAARDAAATDPASFRTGRAKAA